MVDALIEQALPQEDIYLIEINNPTGRSSPHTLKFDWRNLPYNTKIFFIFERLRFSAGGRTGVSLTSPAELERQGIRIVHGIGDLFPNEVRYRGTLRRFDKRRIYQLFLTNNRFNIFPEIKIPASEPYILLAINIILPRYTDSNQSLQFSIIQQSGQNIIGGSTYSVQPTKKIK